MPGPTAAAAMNWPVFWMPRALPDQDGPAASATEVKDRPLSATLTVEARTGTTPNAARRAGGRGEGQALVGHGGGWGHDQHPRRGDGPVQPAAARQCQHDDDA